MLLFDVIVIVYLKRDKPLGDLKMKTKSSCIGPSKLR